MVKISTNFFFLLRITTTINFPSHREANAFDRADCEASIAGIAGSTKNLMTVHRLFTIINTLIS